MDNEKDKQSQTGPDNQTGPSGPSAEEQKQLNLKAENERLEKEKLAKEEHLTNITKAIDEAEQELKRARDAKKNPPLKEGEEEIPPIDMNDPGSKAWDKRIRETVDPVQQNVEKGKQEVRTFALREFLADKPSLASNPDKVKELMTVYDRIKTATETTKEGVLLDLKRAFGAIYSDTLIEMARNNKVEGARQQQLFVDPVIDKGTTSYNNDEERIPNMSEQDKAQLAAWGLTPQEWWDMKKTTDAKKT